MRKRLKGTRTRVLGTGVAAVLVIGLAAASAIGATAGSSAKSLNVGNITAVTNLGGTFTGFQSGVKAFFSYYNAQGGVGGYHINLTSLDDAGDPGKNASEARQLVEQNKVLAIVGEASIADAGSQKYLQGKGVPVIGGWAASSTWHKPATNMFVSLEGPNTPYCPIWSSDQAKRRGIKSIAFVAQDFPSAIQDAVCRSNAAKFQGVKMAGSNLTQQAVINADNSLTAFTAGGLTAITNWKDAGHTGHKPPYCGAIIKVSGTKYVPALNTGRNVFNCFESLNPNKGPVFPVPAGTPAPG